LFCVATPYSTRQAPAKGRVVKAYRLALIPWDLRFCVSSPRHDGIAHVSSPLSAL
jgi:hypothetical protein